MPVSEEVGACATALRLVFGEGEVACAKLADDSSLLGGALFGRFATPLPGGMPLAKIDAPVLAGAGCDGEFWLTSERISTPLTTGGDGPAFRYRHDGHMLFGLITLSEADFESADGNSLQAATESAYARVFTLMDTLGYPHLLRCWNYFADINAQAGELERYRHFNIGRQQAFTLFGRATADHVPAACALGTRGGPLTVLFLASKDLSPIAVENPRQVSAYHYPPDYGPRAPTFARAVVVPLAERPLLLVSGTASIVGHQSVHPDDAQAQTDEAFNNIEALLDAAADIDGNYRFSAADLHYRVYVRHVADLPKIQATLSSRLAKAGTPRVVYVQADVCRSDLLIEIEAAGFAPPRSPN